jgi:hypothetical protein
MSDLICLGIYEQHPIGNTITQVSRSALNCLNYFLRRFVGLAKSEAGGPLFIGKEKSSTWRLTRCESHVNDVSRSNHKVMRK